MQGIGSGLIALGLVGGIIAWRQSRQPVNISGRVAVIMGGSRGLGFLLARKLAQMRCHVVICARDEETLERARGELSRSTGAEILAIPADVSDRAQVERVIEAARDRYGAVDILINNAGVIQVGPVESMTIQDFQDAMNVMYWGVVYPSLAVLPHMRARRGGHIVNITSIGGKIAMPHLLPYSGAKFAAVGFSQGLAAEVRDHGIRVTNISPGLLRTGSYLHARFKGNHGDELTWFGVGASLPLVAMDADRAADQIIMALRKGEPDRVLSLPAVAMATFHGVFPGLTVDLLTLVDRFILPKAPGEPTENRPGIDLPRSQAGWFKRLTTFGRGAARELNQMGAG